MKNVYFIGIGGIGMSALARYFKFRGFGVSGYDKTPSDLTAALEREGIAVHYEDRPDLIPADVEETLVIWTPAIHELGELDFVREKGYRLIKRSRALGEVARGQRCLAVAGTHGKTTTSTLTAHIFTESGEGCTAFLGGISRNYGTNLLMSRNDVVVAEADEFDRSFHQLFPEIAVITAIALTFGLDPEAVKHAIGTFQGVKRRLEVHVNTPKVSYVDDYAHHPAELASAISSLRDIFPGRKITAIFQPHLYTRTRDFAPDFAKALSAVDKLILLPIYPAREEPIPGVTSDIILSAATTPEKVLVPKEELMDYLEKEPVDVLVTFGAGNIDRFVEPITQLLSARS